MNSRKLLSENPLRKSTPTPPEKFENCKSPLFANIEIFLGPHCRKWERRREGGGEGEGQCMGLAENFQVTQSTQSQLTKVKFACKCLTGSSIPTPLNLTIKTAEQHLLCCSCAFIVDFE